MKRNRLNHFADAIIGILNGWQVIADAEVFKKCGAGIYSIDLLHETVSFNGKVIAPLPVFSYMFEWFENETKNNTNPDAVLTTAKVLFSVGEKSESGSYCLEYGLFGVTLYKKRIQTYGNRDRGSFLKQTAVTIPKRGMGLSFEYPS